MTNPSMYIEPGYFADGYVVSPCPVVLTSGDSRIDLRTPSNLSGSIRLLAPEEYSAGWSRFGFDARAIVHTLSIQYSRMNGVERDAIDNFFDTVDFTAMPFNYTDAATGNQFPVQFQTPEISLDQTSYDLYQTTLSLWSSQTFFPAPAVPTSVSALLNAAHYPEPVKRAKKQPLTRMSDGSICVYNKSTITRTSRTCSLVRISRDDLASLIAHFISVGGMRDLWTWTVVPPVLIEEGTINLATNSEYFTIGANSCVITENTHTAPDGAMTADTVADTLIAGASSWYRSITVAPSDDIYTWSVYMKKQANTGYIPRFMIRFLSGGTDQQSHFSVNTETGTVTGATFVAGGNGTIVVLDVGSFWRICLTGSDIDTIPLNNQARLYVYPAYSVSGGASSVPSLTGSIVLWGLQLEQKLHATSYIPTASAPATRSDTYTTPITRTCRYATSEISWQRSSVQSSTYDVQVNMEEDL